MPCFELCVDRALSGVLNNSRGNYALAIHITTARPMLKHTERLVLPVLLMLFSMSALAFGPVLRFEHLTIKDGLSQNAVYAILQDRQGFMWFGTADGLNRFDGYEFKLFRHDPQDPTTLSDNFIYTLYEGDNGSIWVGTRGGGLNRYDRQHERFTRFDLGHNYVTSIQEDIGGILWVGTRGGGLSKLEPESNQLVHFRYEANNPGSLSDDNVLSVFEDHQGTLWVGTQNGLNRFDPFSKSFKRYFHQNDDPRSLSNNKINTIFQDNQGTLWIGTEQGLNRFDSRTELFTRYQHQKGDLLSLSHNEVWTIGQGDSGMLWVGTYGGGLDLFEPDQGRFSNYQYNSSDFDSISHGVILSLLQDSNGLLWVGTHGGGVDKVNTSQRHFGHVKHDASQQHSLSHNDVKSIFQDRYGAVWVGTRGGGLNKSNHKNEGFEHFRHIPTDPHSISSDTVWSIVQGASGPLWLATDAGLNRFDGLTGRFKHYRHDTTDPDSVSHDEIQILYLDTKQTLWLGTWGGGLNRFWAPYHKFEHFGYQADDPTSLSDDFVTALFEDSDNQLWVGTTSGLNKFDEVSGRFVRYRHADDQPDSLSHDYVMTIYQDSNGILWVATYGGGLNKFNQTTDSFTHYREKDGLANDGMYGIAEDRQGYLWLSTNQGLSRFYPPTAVFKNYDVADGLQSNEFNSGAYFRSKRGELFFGGLNGFNRFYPEAIQQNQHAPEVVFTDLLLSNKPVGVSTSPHQDKGRFSLPKTINEMTALTLGYRQSLVSFEFAALDHAKPMKNQYKYKLEGLDDNWINTSAKNRRATYTNLPPGDYTLRVKGANADNYWSEQGASIDIRVNPPPWFSWWALTFYVLFAVLTLLALANAQRKKVKNAYALNRQLQQVDKLKDEFLANTSHELRTPLNGIIGLAESLMDGIGGEQSAVSRSNLAMIVASGKRLSNLVNDILDFSKLTNRNLTLNTKAVDLHSVVEVVLTISRPLLGDKNLVLVNDVLCGLPAVLADEDRLVQIMHNLVGNAIKFTDSGEVKVSALVRDGQLEVQVKDTGIGIAQDQFKKIFESFEQLQGSTDRLYSGTGLGLAITKQLVRMHGGEIFVTSALGRGSTFSITLPITQELADIHPDADQVIGIARLQDNGVMPQVIRKSDASRFHILVVDDDAVNRQVLCNHLSLQSYQLTEAGGGVEALQLLLPEAPSDSSNALKSLKQKPPFDLILLDVMMPRMSGYEVCEKLRETWPVSDLPVIFLTAKNQVADLVQCFAVGANDYLGKPMTKHELISRVEIHLRLLDINRDLESRVAERTKDLVQAEKMVSLGTLTAGVAHEINNPTNFAHVSAQNLQVDLMRFQSFIIDLAGEDAEQAVLDSFQNHFVPLYEHLETIKEGTARIKAIVRDLYTFTQLDCDDSKIVNIADCLQSTINLVHTRNNKIAEFITDFKDSPLLLCHPAQLNQVFMNLIVNGCESIQASWGENDRGTRGKIVVSCEVIAGHILICVKDNGVGISE